MHNPPTLDVLTILQTDPPIRVSHVDGDLDMLKWCQDRGMMRNGKRNILHRVIMGRILGRKLTAHEIVMFRDGDKTNCTRDNLIIKSRSDIIPLWRKTQRTYPYYLEYVAYDSDIGKWIALPDGSHFESEQDAMLHCVRIGVML